MPGASTPAKFAGVMPRKPLANCNFKPYHKPGADPWQIVGNP